MCYLCYFYYRFIVAITFCHLSNSQNAVGINLGLLNVNFKRTRAKERSYFTIISALLPIPGHLIVQDFICPGRGTHTRHSGTVPGIPGQLVTLLAASTLCRETRPAHTSSTNHFRKDS